MRTSSEFDKAYKEYFLAKHELSKLTKIFKYKESFKHISGKMVHAEALIPITYELGDGARIRHAIISTMSVGGDLGNGWLKVFKQSSWRGVTISLEAFLNLPDWYEGADALVCTVSES